MNTVYSAKPSLRIFQIVGATPIAIDRSLKVVPSIKVQTYTLALLVIFAITFVFGLFNSQLHLNNDNNGIGNTVDYIQLVGIRICHILILIESLLQQGTLCHFFDKINEVDIELQRKLNIIIDYRDSRRRISLRLASLLCFYIFCESVFVLLVTMRNDTEFFEYWAVYLLPFIVCCLKYSQTIGFVQLLKSRYQLLNDKLSSLRWIKPEKKLIVGNGYESCPQQLVQTTTFDEMLVIRGLLNRMCDLSGLVNRMFGWSMLVNVGNDFVAITSNSYFIFVYFQDTTIQNKDSWRILGSLIWSAPHLFNIVLLTAVCHSTVETANQIGLTVHKMEYDHLDDNQNSFMGQLSLQLLHQKVAFTASGFFNVDFTLLFTMIGATTTYLIILIQFHMSE